MSLIAHVVKLINESPGSTGDDILPDCEGYTREQVLQALQNAAYARKLRCEGGRGGQGRNKGSKPGRYYPLAPVKRAVPRVALGPNSIFQLGERAQA